MLFGDICIISAIFLLGNLTIIFCFFSLRIIYKNAYLHNAFGYICGAKSIAEAIIGVCFGLWAAPIAIFNPDISQSSFGFIFGHALIFCDFLTILLHFCKSINRFYAILFPIHFHSKFTIRVGIILILGVTVLSFGFSCYLFSYSCNYYFNAATFLWSTRARPCPAMAYFYYASTFITVAGCVICDTVTFGYMVVFRKRVQQQQKQASISRTTERRFFLQTFLTTILYIFMMLCFNLLTKVAGSLTGIVLVTTISWILFHFLHQVVFVAFSLKIKKSVMKGSTVSKISPSMYSPSKMYPSSKIGISKIVIQ